jgi:rhamnosyltransferase subunit B
MAHDQPDNAARIQRLGVGLTITPREYTPDRVAASLRTLLASKTVSAACRRYADKMIPTETLPLVCTEIEQVAARYPA